MKWQYQVLFYVCLIIFSPIIILGLCVALIVYLFGLPKKKKEYFESEYYKALSLPFKSSLLYSPEFRFYNGSKKRNITFTYTRQKSNGLEYFVYKNILYMFPDFDQIDFSEEKFYWEVDYDGDWSPFEDAYTSMVSKIDGEINVSCIKLIVERNMVPTTDLNGVDIPDCIFLTWDYENAFEDDESPSKLRVPTSTNDLFDMMKQTDDLCGDFHIADSGHLVWDLYESVQIDIDVDPSECCIEANRRSTGGIERGITHWHPTIFEIYNEVYKIGKKGNLLILRTFFPGGDVLYMGPKENCPYDIDYKQVFGKIYYLEAK